MLRFVQPALNMQTKDGRKAQGITSAEFVEVMDSIREALLTRENRKKLKAGERWLYSYDNDKVHMGADLRQAGIEPRDRFDLPPCSSDMHKVVEHVHGWLQGRMQKWLEDMDEQRLTADACKAELKRLFCQILTTRSIAADVATLKDTYRAIIRAQGGYPPKKHR